MPLAAVRRHLPGGHRRLHRDSPPRQLCQGRPGPGVTEPNYLQAPGHPVPDERGGHVAELVPLPEREARVIIHGQLRDLRTRVCRHPDTSACPARTRSAPDRTGSRLACTGAFAGISPVLFTTTLTASRARCKSLKGPVRYPLALSPCAFPPRRLRAAAMILAPRLTCREQTGRCQCAFLFMSICVR